MKTLFKFATILFFMTTVAQTSFEDTPTSLTPMYGGSFNTGDVNEDGNIDYLQTGSIAHPVGSDPIPKTILSTGDGNGNVTENTNHDFPDVSGGGGILEDINNDGYLDAFIFGRKENGQFVAEIHLGDGNGNFTFHQSLTGLYGSRAAFGNLNNDSYLDLVTTGKDDNFVIRTIVYRNDNGTFTEVSTEMDGAIAGDVIIFDYDGSKGVLIGGDKSNENITKLYKNLGNFTFSLVNSSFPAASGSSFDVADLDNDGYMDLGINGFGSIGIFTHIYLNNGDGTFGTPQELTGVYGGDIVFKDINRDGKPDTFIIGNINQSGGKTAKLYLNDGTGNMLFNRSFNPGLVDSSAIIVDMDNDSNMDIGYQGDEADFPFNSPVIKMWRNTTLGVEDFTQDKVSVYPNPTRGIVNIELPNDVFVTNYTVTDMAGKVMKVSNNGSQINLSSLQVGIYLLTLQTESGSVTKKLIKN